MFTNNIFCEWKGGSGRRQFWWEKLRLPPDKDNIMDRSGKYDLQRDTKGHSDQGIAHKELL